MHATRIGPSKMYFAPAGWHALSALVSVVMSIPPHAAVTAVASSWHAFIAIEASPRHVWNDALSAQPPHAENVQSKRFCMALPHAVLPVIVA